MPGSADLESTYSRRFFRPTAIFCGSLLLLICIGIIKGPFIGPDTEKFLHAGNEILNVLLTDGREVNELSEVHLFPSYTIPSVLLTLVHSRSQLGPIGAMALNSVLFSLLVVVIFLLWSKILPAIEGRLTVQHVVAGTAGGFYVIFGLADGFLWSYAVLTDIIFLTWTGLFVWMVTLGILEKSLIYWALAFLVSVSGLFVRPTGILLPVLALTFVFLTYLPGIRQRLMVCAGLTLAFPILLVILCAPPMMAAFANDFSLIDEKVPELIQQQVRQAAYFFSSGVVISNRIELPVPDVISSLDVLKSIGIRLFYYWVPIRIGSDPYSVLHNLANITYMVVTLPLLFIGIRSIYCDDRNLKLILLFLLSTSLWYALLHSITLVSFDWRYQLPAMIPYWLLSGVGLLRTLERWYRPRTLRNQTA